VLGAAEWPQIVYPTLSRRPTPSELEIRLGVIEVHPPSASSVGKAAGWHRQEHRLLDPAWNLVAIDRGDIDCVDHRTRCHAGLRHANVHCCPPAQGSNGGTNLGDLGTLGSGLPQTHHVALGVLEVGECAHTGDRSPRRDGATAFSLDLLESIVDAIDVDRDHRCG